MSSPATQALSSETSAEAPSHDERGLKCKDCKQGYADCECPVVWCTEAEKRARTKEIQNIKRGKLAEGSLQPGSVMRARLRLRLPATLVHRLRLSAREMGIGLSVLVERLLKTHSGEGERVRSWGEIEALSVTVDGLLIERFRLRGRVEGKGVSELVRAHLEKELYGRGVVL